MYQKKSYWAHSSQTKRHEKNIASELLIQRIMRTLTRKSDRTLLHQETRSLVARRPRDLAHKPKGRKNNSHAHCSPFLCICPSHSRLTTVKPRGYHLIKTRIHNFLSDAHQQFLQSLAHWAILPRFLKGTARYDTFSVSFYAIV